MENAVMAMDMAVDAPAAVAERARLSYCPVLVQYSDRAPSADMRQTDMDEVTTLALAAVKAATTSDETAPLKLFIHEHAERGEEASVGALVGYWMRNARVETDDQREAINSLVASILDSPPQLLKGPDDKKRFAVLFRFTDEQFNIVRSLLDDAPLEAPVVASSVFDGLSNNEEDSTVEFVVPSQADHLPGPSPVLPTPPATPEPWAEGGAPANVMRTRVSAASTSEIHKRQQDVAKLILGRIEAVLKEKSNRLLSSFKQVKFLIGTAYLNTLRDQTRARLNNLSEANRVLPPGVQDGKDFVVTYGSGAENYDLFWRFRESVLDDRDVLHLLIMDECHWGSTKGGWNALYVNDSPVLQSEFPAASTSGNSGTVSGRGVVYNPGEYIPNGEMLKRGNFVVLLVSATPYNVLTAASRVPKSALTLLSSPASSTDPGIQDRDDHVILWDEEFQHRVSTGSVNVHLKSCAFRVEKSPNTGSKKKTSAPQIRASIVSSDASGMYQDGDDFVEATSTGLLLARQPEHKAREKFQTRIQLSKPTAGPGVLISVMTPANERMWVTATNDYVELLGDQTRAAHFRLRQEFGYGVLAFELVEDNNGPKQGPKHMLMVDTATRKLKIGTDASNRNQTTLQFLYEEISTEPAVYQSLTYYFNTMRLFNPMDRRIRTDDPQTSASLVGHGDPVQVLSFDYAYSILHFAAFWATLCLSKTSLPNECLSQTPKRDNSPQTAGLLANLLERTQDEWQKCHQKLDTLIHEFDQRLAETTHTVRIAANITTLQRLRVRREEWAEAALPAGSTKTKDGACAAAWNILKYSSAAANDSARFNEIIQCLRDQSSSILLAGWEHGLSETERLVHDLIVNNTAESAQGGVELAGKMKIVRITTISEATKFYTTVRLASEIAQLQRQYAILADYGTMDIDDQFKKDKLLQLWRDRLAPNMPEWIPHAYEDLLGLPCLLVLVQRGRMGDTFPTSFNCLDMRLSYNTSGSPIHLSTLVQELGRLCRYTTRTDLVSSLPYALVSQRLFDKLVDALENNLTLAKGFLTTPDQRVTLAKELSKCVYPPVRWAPAVATPAHYDGDVRTMRPKEACHDRRLVLQAEPQIGKTGTFLSLIRQLQDKVNLKPVVVFEPDILLEDEVESEPEVWLFPHWRLMDEFRPELPRQLISDSKYNVHNPLRPNQPWRYGDVFPREALATLVEKDLPVGIALPQQRKTVTVPKASASDKELQATAAALSAAAAQATQVEDRENRYRLAAHDRNHTANCPGCAEIVSRPSRGHLDLTDAQLETMGLRKSACVRVSVPDHYVQCGYVENANSKIRLVPTLGGSCRGALQHPGQVQLQHWILTPSVRSDTALLNLNHAMVSNLVRDGQDVFLGVRHAQMVAARPGKDFEAFVEHWGKHLLIVELPETMYLPYVPGSEGYKLNETVDAEEERVTQGVGYARRFLQLVAEIFHLPFAYMMDDNIFHMTELVLPLERRESAKQLLKTRPCALGDVLLHLQSAATGYDSSGKPVSPPQSALTPNREVAKAFDRYSENTAENAMLDPTLPELFEYTGPPQKYGAWGTHKCEFRATTLSPFKRGHVHSLLLLNITALKEATVAYQCWPFWEDLDFDAQIFNAGLWTCKFNRFIQVKRCAHGPDRPPSAPSAASQLPGLYEWPQDAVILWPPAISPTDAPASGQDQSEPVRLLKALPTAFAGTAKPKVIISDITRNDIDKYLTTKGGYVKDELQSTNIWEPKKPFSVPFVVIKPEPAAATTESIKEHFLNLSSNVPTDDAETIECAVVLLATPGVYYSCSTELEDLSTELSKKCWDIPVHTIHMFSVADPRTSPSTRFALITFTLEPKRRHVQWPLGNLPARLPGGTPIDPVLASSPARADSKKRLATATSESSVTSPISKRTKNNGNSSGNSSGGTHMAAGAGGSTPPKPRQKPKSRAASVPNVLPPPGSLANQPVVKLMVGTTTTATQSWQPALSQNLATAAPTASASAASAGPTAASARPVQASNTPRPPTSRTLAAQPSLPRMATAQRPLSTAPQPLVSDGRGPHSPGASGSPQAGTAQAAAYSLTPPPAAPTNQGSPSAETTSVAVAASSPLVQSTAIGLPRPPPLLPEPPFAPWMPGGHSK